jgi:DNA polymerase III epsilon subunit-like protein
MKIVWDTETTGLTLPSVADLDKQPRIIEFACVVLDDKYKRVSEYQTLINPEHPISAEITKITGLTDADLKDAPSFPEVIGEIIEQFIGIRTMYAHNLPFDMNMLINDLRRIGKEYAFPYPPKQICTVQLTKHLLGRNVKLSDLYEKIMKKPLNQTHRAMDDVNALVEIIIKGKY